MHVFRDSAAGLRDDASARRLMPRTASSRLAWWTGTTARPKWRWKSRNWRSSDQHSGSSPVMPARLDRLSMTISSTSTSRRARARRTRRLHRANPARRRLDDCDADGRRLRSRQAPPAGQVQCIQAFHLTQQKCWALSGGCELRNLSRRSRGCVEMKLPNLHSRDPGRLLR